MNTEPMNALNALDRIAAGYLPSSEGRKRVDAIRAAVAELMRREAVQAELIADLRVQCVRNLELGAYGVGYWEDALESIDAALARVQGGTP